MSKCKKCGKEMTVSEQHPSVLYCASCLIYKLPNTVISPSATSFNMPCSAISLNIPKKPKYVVASQLTAIAYSQSQEVMSVPEGMPVARQAAVELQWLVDDFNDGDKND